MDSINEADGLCQRSEVGEVRLTRAFPGVVESAEDPIKIKRQARSCRRRSRFVDDSSRMEEPCPI